MHGMHPHHRFANVRPGPQRKPRCDAPVAAYMEAVHPRSDETTLPAGVNRTRVSEMRPPGSDALRRTRIPRVCRRSHVRSFRERNGDGMTRRPTG